jgi:hypothetical protein
MPALDLLQLLDEQLSHGSLLSFKKTLRGPRTQSFPSLATATGTFLATGEGRDAAASTVAARVVRSVMPALDLLQLLDE